MTSTPTTPFPRFNVIAAMANHRVIGSGNTMPWHLPPDLKRFKALTLGHRLIMGRKTFESIGRPLPGRETVVISRSPKEIPDVVWAKSLEDALKIPRKPEQKIFVAGGGQIYDQALANFAPHIEKLYLTFIALDVAGDAWFPTVDWSQWRLEKEESHIYETNPPLSYRWVDYIPS